MSSAHRERQDVRRPTFRDHRTPQFGSDHRPHKNPAHYPQRRTLSPTRRSTDGSPPIRRHNETRTRSPDSRSRDHREHHRFGHGDSKEAAVTSSLPSSGSSRSATSNRVGSGDRRRDSVRDEQSKHEGNKRDDKSDRSRGSNVAARIQEPITSRNHNEIKTQATNRPDNRVMSYANGTSSTPANSSSRKRHSSGDRHKSSSNSSRRHEEKSSSSATKRSHDEKSSSESNRRHEEKPKSDSSRKNDEKASSDSSSRRRGDDKDKDRHHRRGDEKKEDKNKKNEEKKDIAKEEKRIDDENREEDEAVAIQGLVEVDCCGADESSEQVPLPNEDDIDEKSSEKSAHSGASNTSAISDGEEELDYEEDDIDIDLGDDIDIETMKAAVRGSLKTDEEETDENDEMKDDNEKEKKEKKSGEPEKKRPRTEDKDDKEKKTGSTPSKSHRRRDEKKESASTSDRKERHRSPARRRDSDRKESRRPERITTVERSSQRGGAGTEIKRIPSLLTMRITAPPGIKKMDSLYHSSVGSSSSSHSSEMVSSRQCQCSCAHHLPSTSTSGSLNASPASTSSSNSDASVSRIPSLMSLRTPFNNSCLFLAPSPPLPRRNNDTPPARIRASSPRRSFGDRGMQRAEERQGGRHLGGGKQRERTPDRVRRDDRRGSSFDDRKRVDRGPVDNGKNRSPPRRRLSPPRGRPGEKFVQSYRNGV